MAFQEYVYKNIEYDKDNDTCKIEVEIVDDILGPMPYTFILGSKHFNGKGLTATARNNVIRAEVKKAVSAYHTKKMEKYIEKSSVPNKIKIKNFAKVVDLNA